MYLKPLVSVIIPVYDRIQYVGEAISSVLAQSYENHEIIVVDDGSRVDIKNCLAAYRDKVKFISQPHKGPSAARNTGVNAAAGKYIAFLDDDDFFEPDKLLNQVNLLENHPDAGFSYSGYFFLKKNKKKLIIPKEKELPEERFVESYFQHIDITMPSLLVRREFFLQAGLFDENIIYNEDVDIWMRMAIKHPVKYSPYPSASVRLHSESLSHKNPLMFKGLIEILESLLKQNSELKKKLGEKADKKIAYLYYSLGWSYLAQNEKRNSMNNFMLYRALKYRKHSKLWMDVLIYILDRTPHLAVSWIYSRLVGIKNIFYGS